MDYQIFPLKDSREYTHLIVLTDPCLSPFDCVDNLSGEPVLNGPRTVLVDQLLHAGNGRERFLKIPLNDQEDHADFVHVKKTDPVRKITCDFLRKSGLSNHPALTSVQSRMIGKGIAI